MWRFTLTYFVTGFMNAFLILSARWRYILKTTGAGAGVVASVTTCLTLEMTETFTPFLIPILIFAVPFYTLQFLAERAARAQGNIQSPA